MSSCGGGGGDDQETQSQTETVYRLQTTTSRTCKACKNHHRYKIFFSATAADSNRAHPGCNCRVVTQQVTPQYYNDVKAHEAGGVTDLRTAFGYVPASA